MRIRYYIEPVTGLRISMNTTFRKMKLKAFSPGHYKIYADVMILELRLVRLKTDDT